MLGNAWQEYDMSRAKDALAYASTKIPEPHPKSKLNPVIIGPSEHRTNLQRLKMEEIEKALNHTLEPKDAKRALQAMLPILKDGHSTSDETSPHRAKERGDQRMRVRHGEDEDNGKIKIYRRVRRKGRYNQVGPNSRAQLPPMEIAGRNLGAGGSRNGSARGDEDDMYSRRSSFSEPALPNYMQSPLHPPKAYLNAIQTPSPVAKYKSRNVDPKAVTINRRYNAHIQNRDFEVLQTGQVSPLKAGKRWDDSHTLDHVNKTHRKKVAEEKQARNGVHLSPIVSSSQEEITKHHEQNVTEKGKSKIEPFNIYNDISYSVTQEAPYNAKAVMAFLKMERSHHADFSKYWKWKEARDRDWKEKQEAYERKLQEVGRMHAMYRDQLAAASSGYRGDTSMTDSIASSAYHSQLNSAEGHRVDSYSPLDDGYDYRGDALALIGLSHDGEAHYAARYDAESADYHGDRTVLDPNMLERDLNESDMKLISKYFNAAHNPAGQKGKSPKAFNQAAARTSGAGNGNELPQNGGDERNALPRSKKGSPENADIVSGLGALTPLEMDDLKRNLRNKNGDNGDEDFDMIEGDDIMHEMRRLSVGQTNNKSIDAVLHATVNASTNLAIGQTLSPRINEAVEQANVYIHLKRSARLSGQEVPSVPWEPKVIKDYMPDISSPAGIAHVSPRSSIGHGKTLQSLTKNVVLPGLSLAKKRARASMLEQEQVQDDAADAIEQVGNAVLAAGSTPALGTREHTADSTNNGTAHEHPDDLLRWSMALDVNDV